MEIPMHPDECSHGNARIEGVNECVVCQRDALKAELANVQAENRRLVDWKKNILNVIKSTPEYEPGEWAGDKEGWGYCFEMVAYSLRERQSLTARCQRLKVEAVEMHAEHEKRIALWEEDARRYTDSADFWRAKAERFQTLLVEACEIGGRWVGADGPLFDDGYKVDEQRLSEIRSALHSPDEGDGNGALK